MRSRIPAVLPSDPAEFGADIQRIFQELGRALGFDSMAAECSPALDVYENDDAIEISMDLPGVDPAEVRILVKGDALLIAGEKLARRGRGDFSFHLVERSIGRFARTVRLMAPCDAARARATLSGGELRITMPKIPDRRGNPIVVPIDTPEPAEHG